ncbi:hypothetical protein, partial [Streptomyces sp. NPDC054838]
MHRHRPSQPLASVEPASQDPLPMFRTALRNVSAHKTRLLMTAFAVMLGVTFITGSLVYGDSLSQATAAEATDGYARIAVNVSADADSANGGRPGDLDARTATSL